MNKLTSSGHYSQRCCFHTNRPTHTPKLLNMVVDAAAKRSATAVGKEETVGESLAVAYRRPANPDPYYFSIGSIYGASGRDAAAALALGDSLMAAVVRRPTNTH